MTYFWITVQNLVVWYAAWWTVFMQHGSKWWLVLGLVLTTRYPHEKEGED